ncbi:E3 ubiquitin-protein ligase TRAIP-like [Elysia marginata]|uniref:E3 ubiquitin-protein ligase TRAIP-like n=1 Tax=Elysia marginata TaxID=1093978 RepID=A0AAV4G964_9GAST|nr:E3 ubiquitin-protein ligase TRAIP-like [Elysia marginata]
MRAQCCICADLFESTQTVNISATPCGHVFHEACLMRWMDTSSTCPSCRTHIKKTQVIKRLFFDISEEVDGDEDVSRFKNQVSDLKAQVREKAKQVRDTEEARDNYQALLAVSEAKLGEVSTKLSREVSLKEVLKADLKRVQKENDLQIQEIQELQKKADKVHELQRVELILKGSSSDAEEMLQQYSDGGDSAIRQLSSLVTVMKREYNQVLVDKRTAKEHLSKLKQEIGTYKMEAKRAKKETAYLKLELQATNKSLSEKEKENDDNRRKIVHLRKALRHNKTEGSQSFIAALTEDSPNVAYSPMPNSCATPITTRVICNTTKEDQENRSASPASPPPNKKPCLSPDLFAETPVKETKADAVAEEDDPKNLPAPKQHRPPHTKTIASEAGETVSKTSQEPEDDGPYIPPAMMSIMHTKLIGRSNPYSSCNQSGSVITRGFDGFGGSTTFVHPQGPPRGSFMKLAQHKKKSKSTGLKMNVNIQRLAVPKSQRQIKECLGAMSSEAGLVHKPTTLSSSSSLNIASSSLSSKSASSSLKNLPVGNLNKPQSSLLPSSRRNIKNPSLSSTSKLSSSKLGMFISKGPSLSTAKTTSAPKDDFIDLT